MVDQILRVTGCTVIVLGIIGLFANFIRIMLFTPIESEKDSPKNTQKLLEALTAEQHANELNQIAYEAIHAMIREAISASVRATSDNTKESGSKNHNNG